MIAQFALRLLLGMSLTWAVLPRRQITSGFFRIQLLVALGLSVLAVVSAGGLFDALQPSLRAAPDATSIAPPEPRVPNSVAVGGCIALAVCSFLGSVAWTLERRRGGTVFLFLILAIAGALLTVAVAPSLRFRAEHWGRVVSEFSSAAILGSCVTAMLLGHWYLTATAMALEPLKRANLWFGATILVRLVLSAVAWARNADVVSLLTTTQTVWLSLRWGAGILLPLVLCVMVHRILRYRNTQSATGVLFAATILVFLGEVAAMQLAREIPTRL
jgi:hypothetical protein